MGEVRRVMRSVRRNVERPALQRPQQASRERPGPAECVAGAVLAQGAGAIVVGDVRQERDILATRLCRSHGVTRDAVCRFASPLPSVAVPIQCRLYGNVTVLPLAQDEGAGQLQGQPPQQENR